MHKILVLDDEPELVRFTSEVFRLWGFEVCPLTNPLESAAAFERFRPDVCVLDFTMPQMSGRHVCRQLKSLDATVEIIFLTAEADTELAIEMMKLGATDYLLKPVDLAQLRTAIMRALEHRRLIRENIAYQQHLELLVAEKTKALNEALRQLGFVHAATLDTLGLALDFRDQSTGGHSVRVAQLTKRIAAAIGVEGSALVQIEQGALLHDIGKLKIPDGILLKPSPLNSSEWDTMRRHPDYGREFLEKIEFLQGAADLVYTHHEKFDGSGYPLGLRAEAIPIGARCFAIVDAVDALIYDRPYHHAVSFDEAAAEIRRCAGSHFDPALVEIALELIANRLQRRKAKHRKAG